MLRRIFDWRDARYTALQLKYQLDKLESDFQSGPATQFPDTSSSEFKLPYYEFKNEFDLVQSRIDEIETNQATDRAYRWAVPLPRKPESKYEENEFWYYSPQLEKFFLTDVGKTYLRREIYTEIEIRFKPFYSTGALLISIASLLIALVKS